MGREAARQTSKPVRIPAGMIPYTQFAKHLMWCMWYNVWFKNHYIKCMVTAQLQADAADARSLLQVSK